MINLIKMNMHRLFRSRVLYITIGIAAAVLIFALAVIIHEDKAARSTASTQDEAIEQMLSESEGEGTVVVGITMNEEASERTSFGNVVQNFFSSGLFLTLVGIFAVVYCEEERKNGFLKNLTLGKKSKVRIYISKLVTGLVYSALLLGTTTLILLIGSLIRGGYSYADFGITLLFVLKHILYHTAFCTLIMLVYELFRNTVVAMTTAFFLSVNIQGYLIALLEQKVSLFTKLSQALDGRFEMVQYTIAMRVKGMELAEEIFPYANSWVLAIIFITLYAVIGTIVFKKRDVV